MRSIRSVRSSRIAPLSRIIGRGTFSAPGASGGGGGFNISYLLLAAGGFLLLIAGGMLILANQ